VAAWAHEGARNLRRIRVRRCLSQERLAFDAGVDRSYVGGLERREENPTVDVLDRLAKTLAVHVSEFFVEPAKGAPPPEPLKSGRRPTLQLRGKARSRIG
jgi:transcriptional regulator with XRE-family HTH domain